LASLAPLLDPSAAVPERGSLDMDLTLSGTLKAVHGSGSAEVRNGEIALPAAGVVYEDMHFRAALEHGRLRIQEARPESRKASVPADGEIRIAVLGRPDLDLTIKPRRFEAIHTRDQKVVASGDLRVIGTPSQPVVTGTLKFDDTDVYLTAAQSSEAANNAAVELTEADYRMMEQTFGEAIEKAPSAVGQLYAASRLDLAVTVGHSVWVRQRTAPRLAVQVTGKFTLKKDPEGEPDLVGRIAPTPGRGFVEEFARQ